MIGQRVMVTKADGSTYFGAAIRWEDNSTLVVRPEDGSAVEKRAFLPHDAVAVASAPALPGADTGVVPKRKYDISNMKSSGNIQKYKDKFGEMTT